MALNWSELKEAGYRVERVVGTMGWRGPCWYAYGPSFAGVRKASKGEAMRACREHRDSAA